MRHDSTTQTNRTPTLSRRGLLAGTLAAAGLGITGCGDMAGAVDGRVRLRQWNLFTGGDGARMVEMHGGFRADHPSIDFEATTFDWGAPFYTKLAMGAAGGRGAHVATLHLARLPGMAPGRLLDPFPVEQLAELGLSGDEFLPDIWNRGMVDGRLYAVPLDTHPFVTYYNRDICERAGVLDSDGRLARTRGLDELVELLTAVREVTGRLGASLDTTGSWRLFWTLYRQLGGEMAFEGDTVRIDDEAAMTVLEAMRRLSEERLIPRHADPPGAAAMFGNAAAGLLFSGPWEITTYQQADMPVGMTLFPNVYGNHRTHADSHAFVLPHRRDVDERSRRAALEYVVWMLKHSVTWAKGGHIPAYQPVVRSEEYLSLEPQSDYRNAAEHVQLDPEAWFSGSASQLLSRADSAFESLHSGASSPGEALEQFKRSAQDLAETPSPV